MFKIILFITFIAVVLTLFTGLSKLTKTDEKSHKSSNKLMFIRVSLSLLLLLEIILYVIFMKN